MKRQTSNTDGDLRELKADLHVHTCLSPCGELEMLPSAIADRARAVGLDVLAVCDHNSTANVLAVAKAAARVSLQVIPGIEITTREEVHILGLFRSTEDLTDLQELIHGSLVEDNDPEAFGYQVVVDEWDEPIGLEPKLLLAATGLTVEAAIDAIHSCGGLAIAAHIDREGFGLIGQLGFVPPGIQLDALEVSARVSQSEWNEKWDDYPVITSSDAHRLEDIGRSTTGFLMKDTSLEEIGLAFAQREGRKVLVH